MFNDSTVKKILIALGIVLVLLLVLLSLIDAVYEPPKEVLEYPSGNLSDDVFTEQNNQYVPNESLTKKHVFETVPYIVDLQESNGAVIGSGTVYKLTETKFVYVSEFSDPNSIQDIIKSQFPAALVIDYVPEYTEVVTQVDKKGYINGFSAEYIVEDISVSNGSTTNKAVLMGYLLNMPDVELFAGKHIWISVGTTDISNEVISTCDSYLALLMNTVHVNEEKMQEAKEKAAALAAEAEKAAEDEEEELPPLEVTPAPSESPVEVEESVEAPAGNNDPDLYSVYIPLDEAYRTVHIDVSWSDGNPLAILELFNPDKTLYFDPIDQTEVSASFVLEGNEIGEYELRIRGARDCGTIETPSVTAVTGEDTGGAEGSWEDGVSDVPEGEPEASPEEEPREVSEFDVMTN